jgi:Cu+-exporting ATPase
MRGAEEKGIKAKSAHDFESVTGEGAQAIVDGKSVAIGNAKMMRRVGDFDEARLKSAGAYRNEGQTVMFVAVDAKAAGLIGVADPIESTTREAIARLHPHELTVVMLTGDSEATALAVARQVGIEDVRADVSPEDKNRIVRELQKSGKVVAMAGDGINDAPALAQADVGIAMGTGTDVAMESAGVTLVKGDMLGIARAIELSHATMRNIRQNLFFAFFYNTLGLPLAAGGLYPVFGLLLSPMIAAAAMSLSSVSVIANAPAPSQCETVMGSSYVKGSLTLAGTVAIGKGVMIGAGFFALTGQGAALAGALFPLAFLLAAVISGFSAYSYIKVSHKYPSAGGIAMILKQAFGSTAVTGERPC